MRSAAFATYAWDSVVGRRCFARAMNYLALLPDALFHLYPSSGADGGWRAVFGTVGGISPGQFGLSPRVDGSPYGWNRAFL